jgi:HK97 gp10 family phage protein
LSQIAAWIGIHEFEAALDDTISKMSAAARQSVSEAASKLEAKAKANAPVLTGTLRRGIMTDPITPYGVGGWQTKVGPTVVYSRRIELGFNGSDSRGRLYHQVGHPYFAPAFEEVAREVSDIFYRNWSKAVVG